MLDAGSTPGGIESTVIDLTTSPPGLLRPGLISVTEIEAVLGVPVVRTSQPSGDKEAPLPSPGMLARHYAPRTPLEVVHGTGRERVLELTRRGCRAGWITRGEEADVPAGVVHRMLPDDSMEYAAGLYAALHDLDEENLERIVVACPPDGDAWLAIRDRLRRAAVPDEQI